jgi:hypothetical protein
MPASAIQIAGSAMSWPASLVFPPKDANPPHFELHPVDSQL